jgi:hypothetical protein
MQAQVTTCEAGNKTGQMATNIGHVATRVAGNKQSWAKLLRSLTVNSLSYFVKTNY